MQHLELIKTEEDAIRFEHGFDKDKKQFKLAAILAPTVIDTVLETCSKFKTNVDITLRNTAMMNLVLFVLRTNSSSKGGVPKREAALNLATALRVGVQEVLGVDLYEIIAHSIIAEFDAPKSTN